MRDEGLRVSETLIYRRESIACRELLEAFSIVAPRDGDPQRSNLFHSSDRDCSMVAAHSRRGETRPDAAAIERSAVLGRAALRRCSKLPSRLRALILEFCGLVEYARLGWGVVAVALRKAIDVERRMEQARRALRRGSEERPETFIRRLDLSSAPLRPPRGSNDVLIDAAPLPSFRNVVRSLGGWELGRAVAKLAEAASGNGCDAQLRWEPGDFELEEG